MFWKEEGLSMLLSTPSRSFQLGYDLAWRELTPAGDYDQEKITHLNCSKRFR